MACHAKVFPQHVAGEDIGRHQVFDGVAIFHYAAFNLLAGKLRDRRGIGSICPAGVEGLLQVNIERNHAPLDIDVLNDDFLRPVAGACGDLQLAGCKFFDLGQQLGFKAVARKAHVAVFQCVSHAPDAVMLLDQQVLALDLLARGVFGRGIKVFDDFEYIGKAWQVKHQHNHAFDAWRDTELVARVAQMVQKVAVKQGLALLGQAKGVVDFVTRFAWHQAAQKLYIGRRHLHIDHEIGAGKAKQQQHVVLAVEGGVYDQTSVGMVQHRQRKSELLKAIDQLAHDVAALVTEKQAREHLQLEIGAQLVVLQTLGNRTGHTLGVPLQVAKGHPQVKILHHLQNRCLHVLQAGIVGAVGWAFFGFGAFDVLRANGRAHKNKIVLKIRSVQYFGGY